MTFKTFIVVSLLAMGLSAQFSVAEPFEDAANATSRGGYKTAFEILQPLARDGSAEAQLIIGLVHISGKGVQQDFVGGVKWIRKAAEHAMPDAQYHLGLMYWNGIGVTRDIAEAIEWLNKAVSQEHPAAQFVLGSMYRRGFDIPQNNVKALKLIQLSAEQGYASAQLNLASLYWIGELVPEDLAIAHKWLSLAVINSKVTDVRLRDNANKWLNSLSQKMSADQLSEARRLAQEWVASRPRQ